MTRTLTRMDGPEPYAVVEDECPICGETYVASYYLEDGESAKNRAVKQAETVAKACCERRTR